MAVETFERPTKHVSWSAMFCGVVVAMALEGVLSFIGNAIGLQLVNPLNLAAARVPGTGSSLWTLGVPLGCLFVGGLIAGLLWSYHTTLDSVVMGLVVWSLVGLFEVGLAAIMSFGAPANIVRTTPTAFTPYNAALWLLFFSATLSLLGSVAGAMVAVRPSVHIPLYREEHRPLTQ